MLFGQQSGLPAYYRRMPGNITDVMTLENTINTLDFLGKVKLHFILEPPHKVRKTNFVIFLTPLITVLLRRIE
jgi:hypothetical protein